GLVQHAVLLQRADSEDVDGTLDARYRFIHWVHQNVCYQHLDAGRRARLHLAVAEQQQKAAGPHAGEIAAQLAEHFERGRDLAGAVTYLRHAAGNAARRLATREALATLEHALALVGRLPDDEETAFALFRERGLVRRAMGDARAAAGDFDAAARTASLLADPAREAGVRLHQAAALAWFDSERCLAAVDRAAALARDLDDVGLAAGTAAHSASWRANWVGSSRRRAERVAHAR